MGGCVSRLLSGNVPREASPTAISLRATGPVSKSSPAVESDAPPLAAAQHIPAETSDADVPESASLNTPRLPYGRVWFRSIHV